MKRLPIGIQSIEKILLNNYIYVDKTMLIYQLIGEAENYFFARPRRFGKSLLVSTLKAIFSGDRGLFKDCQLYLADYDWKKYPIIHLDFTQIVTKNPEALEESLKRKLIEIAQSYGKSIEIFSLQEGLSALVKALAEDAPVVVLIDEYDKPLIDNLGQLEVAKQNRSLLKDFFGTLKGLDNYLRFVFVTGVSKFSQVSLFSGFNNLNDITINPKYSTLVGYTEAEISLYFKEHIEQVAQKQHKTVKEIIDLMRRWYNGYDFSGEKLTVYNPFSTLLFLNNGKVSNYWFQTATPTFLIDQIKKQNQPLDLLSNVQVGETTFNSHDLDNMNLTSLMWQTGYLTIKNYDPSTLLYFLDYPNEEVRVSFVEHLAQGITGMSMPLANNYVRECVLALRECRLEIFFDKLKVFFANIPYEIHVSKEKYYQTVFYVIAKLIGLEAQVEVQTNIGRVDMVVVADNFIYVFEFKINASADEALTQINDKKYFQKYLDQKKKVVLIGVNFNTKEGNISDWKVLNL